MFFDGKFYVSVQEEFDTHDPKAHHFLKLPFLKKRSRIVEIVAARDTVFALTHSGICAAFSRGLVVTFNFCVTQQFVLFKFRRTY